MECELRPERPLSFEHVQLPNCITTTIRNSESIQPKLQGYQLLGDSIFVRLANTVLNQPFKYVDGSCTLGYCVSGQRIIQLALKIKKSVYPLLQKVMVLVGTNDILTGRKLPMMTEDMEKLINILRARKVTKIMIVTLPPIPRLALTRAHWESVRAFNHFLMGIKANDVDTIDIMHLFMKHDPPVIAAPPPQELMYDPPGLALTLGNKRKADKELAFEYGMRLKTKFLVPSLTEESDEKLNEFGRYINKVNRIERLEASIDSEEENEPDCRKPVAYIESKFWQQLQTFLPTEKEETFGSSSEPNSSLPQSDEENGTNVSEDDGLTDLQKDIIKLSTRFLHTEFFEKHIGNRRFDMVHPNPVGLKRLHVFLQCCIISKEANNTK